MIFWYKIAYAHLLYYVKVWFFIILIIYSLDFAKDTIFVAGALVIMSEGLIFNQILSVCGMSIHFSLGSTRLSHFFWTSNVMIIILVNLSHSLILLLLQVWSWEGLIYLNTILVGELLIGNWISNSRIAYSVKIFNIHLLRISICLITFAILTLLFHHFPYILFFFISSIYSFLAFKQFTLQDKYNFIAIDFAQNDNN